MKFLINKKQENNALPIQIVIPLQFVIAKCNIQWTQSTFSSRAAWFPRLVRASSPPAMVHQLRWQRRSEQGRQAGLQQLRRGSCPIQTRYSWLDCYGRRRPLRHGLLWYEWLRCHQPRAESHKGYQGDRLVLHSSLRRSICQSLLAESIHGFRFHAATLIFASYSPPRPSENSRF